MIFCTSGNITVFLVVMLQTDIHQTPHIAKWGTCVAILFFPKIFPFVQEITIFFGKNTKLSRNLPPKIPSVCEYLSRNTTFALSPYCKKSWFFYSAYTIEYNCQTIQTIEYISEYMGNPLYTDISNFLFWFK